jgi:hypothetical protein
MIPAASFRLTSTPFCQELPEVLFMFCQGYQTDGSSEMLRPVMKGNTFHHRAILSHLSE